MMIAIVGPTASGKTSLAIKLAKLLNAEIVNFDAYQVYKELNVGTAKPTQQELDGVKSHLFSCVHVDEEFNIYVFQKMCRETINNLLKENKNIILVGGSGLYLRSVIYDYSFQQEKNDLDLKKYDDESNENLYKKLCDLDAESAAKIHPNNRKRVIRALAIAENLDMTKSENEKLQNHKLLYDLRIIGLNLEREKLYEKINQRVDEMFENGLINEIGFLFKNYDKTLTSFQAIGYKEFLLNLNEEETKELIKKNTRNYAKRQLTFFKHQFENVEWFDSDIDVLKEFNKNI